MKKKMFIFTTIMLLLSFFITSHSLYSAVETEKAEASASVAEKANDLFEAEISETAMEPIEEVVEKKEAVEEAVEPKEIEREQDFPQEERIVTVGPARATPKEELMLLTIELFKMRKKVQEMNASLEAVSKKIESIMERL